MTKIKENWKLAEIERLGKREPIEDGREKVDLKIDSGREKKMNLQIRNFYYFMTHKVIRKECI